MDRDLQKTMKFNIDKDSNKTPKEILLRVYSALREKGYDPVNQIVGYLISGDPTYITSHQNARALIRRLERDELLEELILHYIESNK
ncbi:MAG: IreB family regulatory phosphoprotein [Caldicoprobacterales bacterium]|jgi:uncharacterized protein (UPF0297 family)|nr:IreB family regulatory phosphoprotein [Clostridiales bacterium]